jgi:hypothetical protein
MFVIKPKVPHLLFLLVSIGVTPACRHIEGDDRDVERSVPAATPAESPAEQPAPLKQSGNSLIYNFDGYQIGPLPDVFTSVRTGQGAMGDWQIVADDSAPSRPNVLAQLSNDSTDYRFPVVVSNQGAFKDLELSVKFKTISGRVDQAGGLVFRYKDSGNYYVLRANALEDNFRLYHVVKGSRVQFAGANTQVTPKQWHELKVVCIGNQITCSYDGKQLIQASDDTFRDAGKVGVWTKADSVTYFDDLTVTAR